MFYILLMTQCKMLSHTRYILTLLMHLQPNLTERDKNVHVQQLIKDKYRIRLQHVLSSGTTW